MEEIKASHGQYIVVLDQHGQESQTIQDFFLINSHHVTFTLKCFQDLHIKKILLHSCINILGVILNPSV